MNLSTHLAVGALAGSYSGNPFVGFLAGILSHHIIDLIPHSDGGSLEVDVKDYAKDPRILSIVLLDLIILIALVIFIYFNKEVSQSLIFGAFGGVLPDLIDNMPFWSSGLRKTAAGKIYHSFHERFHYTIPSNGLLWTGVLNQFLLIAISLKLLI